MTTTGPNTQSIEPLPECAPKPKAAAYIRVSTPAQVEEGHLLDEQRDTIAARIESEGWELVEVYADEGISGKSEDRAELQRLLADLPKLDRVVVTGASQPLGHRPPGCSNCSTASRPRGRGPQFRSAKSSTHHGCRSVAAQRLLSVLEFEAEQLGRARRRRLPLEGVEGHYHHGQNAIGYRKSKADVDAGPRALQNRAADFP